MYMYVLGCIMHNSVVHALMQINSISLYFNNQYIKLFNVYTENTPNKLLC